MGDRERYCNRAYFKISIILGRLIFLAIKRWHIGKLVIREPMRDGFIGLNQKHISDPDLIIEISFVNKKGERLWPYQYRLNREKIPSYRAHTIRRGGKRIELTLVPLYDLIRVAE